MALLGTQLQSILLLGVTEYEQGLNFFCFRPFLLLAQFSLFQSFASLLPLVRVFLIPKHLQGSGSATSLWYPLFWHMDLAFLCYAKSSITLLSAFNFHVLWFIHASQSLKLVLVFYFFLPTCLGVIFKKKKGSNIFTLPS